ncbi:MAG: ABC transporter permease [Christensenella sp.]|nr:ABC transporter permease [Christensenella sp.]
MRAKSNISRFVPFLAFILILIVFSILTQGKLIVPSNLSLILEQSFVLIILSIGVTFVMTLGCLDFSQGSLVAICTLAGVYAAKQSFLLAAVVMIGIGLLVGFLNGFMVAKLKMQSFIVTICMMVILRGLTIYLMTSTGAVAAPLDFSKTFDNLWFKIMVLTIVLVVSIYLFNFAKLGKQCRAVGAGELAAIYAGVNASRVKIFSFCIAGITCGLGAFLLMARTGVAAPATGQLLETDILTVLVLGGLPVTGGMNSKIWCGVIGALTLNVLSNGLVILGANAAVLQLAKGLIFLVAVAAVREKQGNLVIK